MLTVQESPRLRLARLAERTALASRGVAGLDAGWSTRSGDARVDGVRVLAAGAGAYTVDLFLRARLGDLRGMAEELRGELHAAARAEGLDALVGPIGVTVTDVEA